jgi:hypothetical protein
LDARSIGCCQCRYSIEAVSLNNAIAASYMIPFTGLPALLESPDDFFCSNSLESKTSGDYNGAGNPV